MRNIVIYLGICPFFYEACSSSRQLPQTDNLRDETTVVVHPTNDSVGNYRASVGTFRQVTMDQIKGEANCPVIISTEPVVSINGINIGMKRKDIQKTFMVKKTGILSDNNHPYYLINADGLLIDALFKGDSIDDEILSATIRVYKVPSGCVVLNGNPIDKFTASSAINGYVCYLTEYIGAYNMKWRGGCPEINDVVYCNPIDFVKYINKRLNVKTPDKIPFEGGTCLSGKYTVNDYNLDAGIVEVKIGE